LLPNNAEGVSVAAGEIFLFGCASGGGLGDPLDREPARVARDLRQGYISEAQAKNVYGVIISGGKVDEQATEAQRAEIRWQRISRAAAPGTSQDSAGISGKSVGALSLTIKVVQHEGGQVACCNRCSRVLAEAPTSWKQGAAVAETPIGEATAAFFVAPVVPRQKPAVIFRELFCPGCATLLECEAVLEGTPLDDDVRPDFYALRA
jgi:N-methylhydantoinase B